MAAIKKQQPAAQYSMITVAAFCAFTEIIKRRNIACAMIKRYLLIAWFLMVKEIYTPLPFFRGNKKIVNDLRVNGFPTVIEEYA